MSKKDDLTHIVAAARKAIPGEWIAVGTWVENESHDLPDPVQTAYSEDREEYAALCATAEYIALVQPKAVLSLIREIRFLREMLGQK